MAKRCSQKRSTKKGRKGMRKSMKGGKNWCCNGNSCNEQGWAPTCTPGNAKYVCDEYVTDPNRVTNDCRQAVVSLAANTTGIVARSPFTNAAAGTGALITAALRGGKRKTNKRRR